MVKVVKSPLIEIEIEIELYKKIQVIDLYIFYMSCFRTIFVDIDAIFGIELCHDVSVG